MSTKQRLVAAFMFLAGCALAAGLVVGALDANDETAHRSSPSSAAAHHRLVSDVSARPRESGHPGRVMRS
jgi:hypothetical protein